MTEVIERQKKSLLEDFDYEQKIRMLTLKKRIEWFVENKPNMSQNEKWDAFRDMHDDYEIDWSRLIEMVNSVIRKKGLSIW
jgi:hypothetical protein